MIVEEYFGEAINLPTRYWNRRPDGLWKAARREDDDREGFGGWRRMRGAVVVAVPLAITAWSTCSSEGGMRGNLESIFNMKKI